MVADISLVRLVKPRQTRNHLPGDNLHLCGGCAVPHNLYADHVGSPHKQRKWLATVCGEHNVLSEDF
jgi:hypothetical protein